MKIKLFVGAILFTLALVSQGACAKILVQIGVAPSGEVTFYSVEVNPAVNNSDYDTYDGITFLNILTEDGKDGDYALVTGDLKASGSGSLPYNRIDESENTWDGFPRSLVMYYDDSAGATPQEFDTSVPAFSGEGMAAADFKNVFTLRGIGATGDIVSGYENGDVSEVIGQWVIVSGAFPSGFISIEEPIDGQVHGGIGNLRGFAFFQIPVEKVEIYIDGEYAFDAPYGGYRSDVADAYPEWDSALNSGFSLAYGYSNLAPGEHTLTARAISVDGYFDERTSTFTVVGFKELFISSNQTVDGTSADVTMQGDEIIIKSVQVGENVYDLKLKWRTAEQGFEIIEID
jgi:hypothetical protein